MPDDYDKFFNPNICHVCKLTNNDNSIICNQCYMVSYCSRDHKELHHSSHMEICTAVQKLLKKKSQWDVCPLNLEEWIQSRKEFLHLVKSELSRDLKSYEVQMIMFARSCFICHQQTNLYTCMMCHSANYCIDHIEAFSNYHSFTCKELLLCLSLDIELFRGLGSTIKFTKFPDECRSFTDMDTFVKQYVQRTHISREVDDWNVPEYFYSDYTSGPLTLYYGMQDANLLDLLEVPDTCYVVHVIDAKHVDRQYISAWEILLHLLRNIKVLRIVLIGSELYNECNDVHLCSKCNNKTYCQRLCFESHHMLYHNYVASELYKRPNVIIGFLTDFNDAETWSESILKLRDQDCPLLLTTKSRLKAEQNINKIKEVLGTSCSPSYHDINKFGSRRPWRDIETDYVYFRNIYLTMYQNLHSVT